MLGFTIGAIAGAIAAISVTTTIVIDIIARHKQDARYLATMILSYPPSSKWAETDPVMYYTFQEIARRIH